VQPDWPTGFRVKEGRQQKRLVEEKTQSSQYAFFYEDGVRGKEAVSFGMGRGTPRREKLKTECERRETGRSTKNFKTVQKQKIEGGCLRGIIVSEQKKQKREKEREKNEEDTCMEKRKTKGSRVWEKREYGVTKAGRQKNSKAVSED